MSPSEAVEWLSALADAAAALPQERVAPPYWSQRQAAPAPADSSLPATVVRVRTVIAEFEENHYFSKIAGFDCVDGLGHTDSSLPRELAQRLGKPDLWDAAPDAWEEEDLLDFIEVMHDLAARPTAGYYHYYGDCGWHPSRFSTQSGQRLYRWRMNALLDTTTLDLRLAESGEDRGRLVRVAAGDLTRLVDEVLENSEANNAETVSHAVALFRSRTSNRETRRSAVVALAGVLESRRSLLQHHLLKKDEAALFQIANNYAIRHRNENQRNDYSDEFLDWVFYWYLATVQLTDRLLTRRRD